MTKEPGLFVNWLRSHHRAGQFNRKDQWGQVSHSRLDEIVLQRMYMMDLEIKASETDARYEEQAFLLSLFAGHPGAKDIFLKMFPQYANETEEGIEFIVPESPEEIKDLLAEVRESGLAGLDFD